MHKFSDVNGIVQWGVIGCGDVTEVKSGPALQNVTGSSIAAVMRRNGDRARDYAERHNISVWYDDAYKLINDPNVTAIYVATPPSTHKMYTLMAANAGKPVYVEKPMAISYNECQEMVSACDEANVPLYVAFYRRALPRFTAIKKLLEQGELGHIRYANSILTQQISEFDSFPENWRVDPEIAGNGYFYDLGSHLIDLMQFYFGDITEASGHSVNQAGLYKADDTVSMSARFKSGITFNGLWCFCSYKEVDKVVIAGDKGRISFSVFKDNSVRIDNQRGTKYFSLRNPKHIQQPLIETISADLNGTGSCTSTGRTGARTNWVLEQITPSYK